MERLHRLTVLVLYQLTLLTGILLLPVALLTQRLGVHLPVDKAVTNVKQSYERAVSP
jgi:hypothetical protein